MKFFNAVLLTLLTSFAVTGQPAEFDPQPCFPSGTNGARFMTVGGLIDNIGGETPAVGDWVAAIDPQGYVIGRKDVRSFTPVACGSQPGPFFSFSVEVAAETDGGDFNGCPAAPYGAAANSTFEIVAWDADGDFGAGAFYTQTVSYTFTEGGQETSSVDNCTPLSFSEIFVNFNNPLPVVLSAFTAEVNRKNEVSLNWVTTQEIDASHFEIERSADGESWEYLDRVLAVGNSTEASAYAFEDTNPLAGQAYYRLKQLDLGGAFYYSEVQIVNRLGAIEGNVTVSPNPVRALDLLTVRLGNEWNLATASANMFDVSGRQVADFTNLEQGSKLAVPQLPVGVYTLRLTDGRRNTTTRVVIR